MPYDLKPRNTAAGCFQWGSFSWPKLLEMGLGLPLGHGAGFRPAQFIYLSRPDGKSVAYNDGARITAKEARQMAQIAVWMADLQDAVREQWMKETEAARIAMMENERRIYTPPLREDLVEKLRLFGAWAVKSGGFRVW